MHMYTQVTLDGRIMGDLGDFYFLFVLSHFPIYNLDE